MPKYIMTDKKICELISSRIRKTDTLLDIGCGEGYLCNCIASKLQKKVTGLDISDKGFQKAHSDSCEEFDACNLVECLIGKAENLDDILGNRTFDVVTFIHSFHHLDDVIQSIIQTKKFLKETGKIIIAEYSQEKGKSEDVCKRYTTESIVNLLMKNFSKVTIEQPENGFFIFTVGCLD